MRRAAAPTNNASLREIVSRNEGKRGPGAEVMVFSLIGTRRHKTAAVQKKDNTRVDVYPPFLSKVFTMALLPLNKITKCAVAG